jgi:hypothetical protein
MTKDWKYIVYISLLGLLLVVLFLSKAKEHDWSLNLSHLSKEPYGTYALNELIPDHLKNGQLVNSYKTVYELKDSIQPDENILIISSRFDPDAEDTKVLLNLVEKGTHAFISSSYFSGKFADTLGLATGDSFFQGDNTFAKSDSASLHFVTPALDSTRTFNYRRSNIHNYFRKIDSVKASVLAKNDFYQPVTVRIKKGKGTLILNCTPIIYTNIYLLANSNQDFVATTLSYLPEGKTYWTEFYHVGRMEAATPLRFILNNEPLRWAYYITISLLLVFMIFEAKRKQRIIPVIKPLVNTTLEFTSTIANLYYQRNDHKNIADKKIQFFFDYIHTHYFMSTTNREELFISTLTRKSGAREQTVKSLTNIINKIISKNKIDKEELVTLNQLLDDFYKKK